MLERLRETSVDEIVVVEGAYELAADAGASRHAARSGNAGPGRRFAAASRRSAKTSKQPSSSLPTGRTSLRRPSNACSTTGARAAESSQRRTTDARGHPLVLGRGDWDAIPDEGLRDRPVRLVPCDDLGAPGDVDVPEDLETL